MIVKPIPITLLHINIGCLIAESQPRFLLYGGRSLVEGQKDSSTEKHVGHTLNKSAFECCLWFLYFFVIAKIVAPKTFGLNRAPFCIPQIPTFI
jgi:hypothetical protein